MKRLSNLHTLLALVTLSATMAACADQDAVISEPTLPEVGNTEVQPFTISATIGDAMQTRTTLSEQGGRYSMVWAAGDEISVVYPGSGWDVAHRFTLSAGEGTKSGTFSDDATIINGLAGHGTNGACEADKDFYLGYYPASAFYTWRGDDRVMTVKSRPIRTTSPQALTTTRCMPSPPTFQT